MKIGVIAPSPVPFVRGGAEWLCESLVREINDRTSHQAELIKVPVREHSLPDLVSAYRAFAGLDTTHFDMVITSKYPAWMVQHPDHRVYMLHKLRGLYDTYHTFGLPQRIVPEDTQLKGFDRFVSSVRSRGELPEVFERFDALVADRGAADPAFALPGPLARLVVHALDRIGLAPTGVRRFAAISRTVAARRDYFPRGAAVDVIYPAPHLEVDELGGAENFVFVSRLDAPKRARLAIEAMAHTRATVPLKIVGSGPEEERLRMLARDDDRVRFLGPLSTRDLVGVYSNAIAAIVIPWQEDLGLVALEAMRAEKPVITCHDSGGPTEFVRDGENGYVTDPSPAALGAAFDRIASDRERARLMGQAARETVRELTWERTISSLLRPDRPQVRRTARRSRLVVLSTFPIHPRAGGGQLRCFYLCCSLAKKYDVQIVSLTHRDGPAGAIELADGVTETTIPRSRAHQAEEDGHTLRVGTPLTDVLASAFIDKTPDYLVQLHRASEGASAAILEHPYLYTALQRVAPDLPLIYSAHNAEFALKPQYFPGDADGRWLSELVRDAEAQATAAADLIVTCSAEDAALLSAEYDVAAERFTVIPNGVDADRIAFTPYDKRLALQSRWLKRYRGSRWSSLSNMAIYVASWHPPNLDAARRIVEMAPACPSTLFVLAGSHSPRVDVVERSTNILRMGLISSLVKDGLLAAAGVAVHPMVLGSGTNLKVAEYLAAGVPVVSTRFGVRGLDVIADEHLKIAETEDFAEAIRELREDADSVAARTRRARSFVEHNYDWRVIGARLVETFDQVLERPTLRSLARS